MVPAAPLGPYGARLRLGSANNARKAAARNSRPPQSPKTRPGSPSAAATFLGAGQKWSPLPRSARTVPGRGWAPLSTLGRPPRPLLDWQESPKRAPAAPRPPQLSFASARIGPRRPARPARRRRAAERRCGSSEGHCGRGLTAKRAQNAAGAAWSRHNFLGRRRKVARRAAAAHLTQGGQLEPQPDTWRVHLAASFAWRWPRSHLRRGKRALKGRARAACRAGGGLPSAFLKRCRPGGAAAPRGTGHAAPRAGQRAAGGGAPWQSKDGRARSAVVGHAARRAAGGALPRADQRWRAQRAPLR